MSRRADSVAIKEAYDEVDRCLAEVGRLLRTTDAGRYLWSADHKTAVSGLRAVISKLRKDVPSYAEDDPL